MSHKKQHIQLNIEDNEPVRNTRKKLYELCETPKAEIVDNSSDDAHTYDGEIEEDSLDEGHIHKTRKIKSNDDNSSNISENIKHFWEAYSESEEDDVKEIDSDIEYGGRRSSVNNLHLTLRNNEQNFSKLSFEQVKTKLSNDFNMPLIYNYSAALDILSSYIKCHIIIYTQASYHCTFLLNLFMMPSIFLSSACSVSSAFAIEHKMISRYVSIVSGVVSFLLAIINYLKLDACAEAHKIAAYQYSKLKNYVEFTSGEILLFQDPALKSKDYIEQQIKLWKKTNKHRFRSLKSYKDAKHAKINEMHKQKKELETKLISSIQGKILEFKKTLKNIQENNNFILPKHISRQYSHVYNINIFTYIKNIEAYRIFLLSEIRNIKNELRFNNFYSEQIQDDAYEANIKYLYERKNELMREFFELNNGYALIDSMFQQEINNIHIKKKHRMSFFMQRILNFFILLSVGCRPSKMPNQYSSTNYFIPKGYKNPMHFGYKDKNGVYLLQKIMEYNRA